MYCIKLTTYILGCCRVHRGQGCSQVKLIVRGIVCPSSLGSANEAPHAPHSLHPHLVQEHLSNNVIVASNMAASIHNGQICEYQHITQQDIEDP